MKIKLFSAIVGIIVATPQANAQETLPSISRAVNVVAAPENFYQPVSNDSSTTKIFYYVPQATVLEEVANRKVFGFQLSTTGKSAVNFRLKLSPSVKLQKNKEAVISELAAMFHVNAADVVLKTVPLLKSSVGIFSPNDAIENKLIPADGFVASAGLDFAFSLSEQGTNWLRSTVVGRRLPFGSLSATAYFYDETSGAKFEETFTLPLTLDQVPKCAVTPAGCTFNW